MNSEPAPTADRQTIFLSTDGRCVIVGRGRVSPEPALLSAVKAQGLRGWVVLLSASLHGRRRPVVEHAEPSNGPEAGQWDGAWAALMARR